MLIKISFDIDIYQYGYEAVLVSLPEEMVKVLEKERKEMYLETISETIRLILSDYLRNKIKSILKKKINRFLNCELPLLIQNELLDKQLLQDILDNPNNTLPEFGKEKVASPKV